MSNTVDNRVVQMKFNNAQFEAGVSTSMSTLERLKTALQFKGGGQGLNELQQSANKFSMASAGQQAEGFSLKMAAIATVGVAALATVTAKAVTAGLTIGKALTLTPIAEGFGEYELKMKSIQTILANTSKDGTKLADVTRELDALNTYADKTIYNFAEMTRNVSLFTNAGISLKDATAIIKGFSNEAAASGVGATEAAGAAYQLSQALNAGVVRLIDWKSLTNAGFGRNMQDGLIELGKAMGKFNENTTSADAAAKNFNGSLESEWLTADVMTNYLRIQAGELSKEQQRALGLTEKQIEAFTKQQKIAEEAATRVRTVTQFWTTLRESISSGWAKTFEIVIGGFDTASTLFDRILNVVTPMVERFSAARNDLLEGWATLGGRQYVIEGIANIFKTIAAILKPLAKAFRALFPPATAEGLTAMSKAFFLFTEKVRIFVEGSADKLTGIFDIIATVAATIWKALKFIAGLGFKAFGGIAGALFEILLSVGELASAFIEWAKPMEKIDAVSDKIASALVPALKTILKYVDLLVKAFILLIREGPEPFLAILSYMGDQLSLDFDKAKEKIDVLGQAFAGIIGKVKSFIESLSFGDKLKGVTDFLGDLRDHILGVGETADKVSKTTEDALSTLREGFSGGMGGAVGAVLDDADTEGPIDRLKRRFEGVVEFLRSMFSSIGDGISNMWDKFKEWLGSINWSELLAVVNTGFFGYIVIQIGKLIGTLRDAIGIGGAAAEALEQVGNVLKAYGRDLNASALLKIAIAVGVLAAAIVLLGTQQTSNLAKGAAAIGAVMTALAIIFNVLGAGSGKGKHAKGYLSPKSMIEQGVAMNLYASALVIISGAILVLAGAIAILGALPADNLKQGGLAIAVLLAAIAAFLKAMSLFPPPMMLNAAASIVAVALALNILAGAVALLGLLPDDVASDGIDRLMDIFLLLGGLMIAVGVAGVTGVGAAAAILAITGALVVLSGLVLALGAVDDKGNIVQGLAILSALGLLITLIAGVLFAFTLLTPAGAAAALLAAKAILVVAGAFWILAKVVETLGNMSVGDGAQAIAMMAALIGLITAMGAIMLTPVGAGLAALGGVLWVIGAAVLAAGAGVFLLATGLALIGTVGAAGIYVLLGAAETALTLIPIFFQQLALGIKGFLVIMVGTIPLFYEGMTKLLAAIIQAIRDNIPEGTAMVLELLGALRKVITEEGPEWLLLAVELITSFIEGIAKNAERIAQAALDTLTAFLDVFGKEENIKKIVNTVGEILLNFINAVSDWIITHSQELEDAGEKLGEAILAGVAAAFKTPWTILTKPIEGAANWIADKWNSVFGVNSPAKRMYPLGEHIVNGIAVGFGETAYADRQITAFADHAESGFQKAVAQLANNIDTNMDMSPTITPIMDMTAFEKDARLINTTLSDYAKISPSVSYQSANELASKEFASSELISAQEPTVVHFEYSQNNTSPASLTTTEIYRQTKNQLSTVKQALQQI